MKKSIRNYLISTGLAGALSLTGCRTPTSWVNYQIKGSPSVEHKKEKYASSSKYLFEESNFKLISQDTFEVPVMEERVDSIQEYDIKTTPVENLHYTAQKVPSNPFDVLVPYPLLGSLLIGLPFIGDSVCLLTGNPEKTMFYDLCNKARGNIVPGTERVRRELVRNEQVNLNFRTYAVPQNLPAAGVKVEASSDKLSFEKVGEKVYLTTDEQGILRTKFSSLEGFLSEQDAAKNVSNILDETYKPGVLGELINGFSFVNKNSAYIKLSTLDEEMTFEVPVYFSVDPRPVINEQIKKSLEAHLQQEFPLKKIEIEVREKVSRIFLNNISLESKQLSGPTREIVLNEEKEFLGKYFNFESDSESISIEPEQYLSAIPKELEFNKRLKGTINKGSVYEIEFTHSGHVAARKIVDFDSEENPIPVEMDRLAAPIENRETEENAGKSTIGQKE